MKAAPIAGLVLALGGFVELSMAATTVPDATIVTLMSVSRAA